MNHLKVAIDVNSYIKVYFFIGNLVSFKIGIQEVHTNAMPSK